MLPVNKTFERAQKTKVHEGAVKDIKLDNFHCLC